MKRIVLALLVGIAVAAAWVGTALSRPYAGFTRPVLIDIPKGTGTRAMAALLADAGVVDGPLPFLAARALRYRSRLQAGEYRFDQPASPLTVVDRLVRGDVHYYELVVPEGSNVFDIARLFEEQGLGRASELLPRLRGKEGFLFPALYRFTRGTTGPALMAEMERQFERAWKSAGGSGDRQAVVTLASLIEKEARVAEERPIIASVYQNRLNRQMKLDCDPTVIYAALLEGKYRGTIYRSDLDRDHPYNTYRRIGLPPGPIANPGLDSLRAALRPASTEYLFFVARADGSGRHVFSRTMAEHDRAVRDYRRAQIEAAATRGAAGRDAGSR